MQHIDLYSGYEEEEEYDFFVIDDDGVIKYSIYSWDGYVWNIFGSPERKNGEWIGFTKLFQLCELDKHNRNNPLKIDSKEFLDDLKLYSNNIYESETQILFEKLLDFLELAIANNYSTFICKE